jgi:transcriptional regulator with XRE-family HTH domain
MSTVGERLKTLRKLGNFKLEELASALKVTTRSIQYYESDQRNLDSKQLIALAKFFDVSVDYLLGISDEPKPIPKKSDQTDKQPGQVEMDTLLNELNEESVAELKKYAEYLKIRQTLDSGNDESSAGLDGGKASNSK